jgi:hypothetical protein
VNIDTLRDLLKFIMINKIRCRIINTHSGSVMGDAIISIKNDYIISEWIDGKLYVTALAHIVSITFEDDFLIREKGLKNSEE